MALPIQRYRQSYRKDCHDWAQTVALLPALCPSCQDVVVDRDHGEAGCLLWNRDRRIRNVIPADVVAFLRMYVVGDTVEAEGDWVKQLISLYLEATGQVAPAPYIG
jgi:hypothetical protein